MKKNNIKEKLLETTLRLISVKGYLGATTREIAHQAGVSELTLFRNFGSKEKLFEAMLRRYTFLPKLMKLLSDLNQISYNKSLEIIGMRFFETLQENKSLVKIMFSEINFYPEKVRSIYNKLIQDLVQTLADHFGKFQEEGIIRQFSAEIAARAFLGMVFFYFRTEEMIEECTISKQKLKKTINEFVRIFVQGTLKNECSK